MATFELLDKFWSVNALEPIATQLAQLIFPSMDPEPRATEFPVSTTLAPESKFASVVLLIVDIAELFVLIFELLVAISLTLELI